MSHDDNVQRPDEQMRHDDIARVWAATDYAPTGARLAPVAEVVAARASQLAPDEGVLVDVGARAGVHRLGGAGLPARHDAADDTGLPFLAGASHLAWGRAETARERLAPYFGHVEIEVCDLDWSFPSVAAGMELYRHGSPPHTASFAAAGERRGELKAVLEDHLRSEAGPDGAIRSQASYLLITATRPRG